MFGLIKRIARQNLYSSGPKNGEVTKVYPAAKTLQGIQPGAGQRLAAEEFNYFLSSASRGSALRLMDALTMRKITTLSGPLRTVAWDPSVGAAYGSSDAHEIILIGPSNVTESSPVGTLFSSEAGSPKSAVRRGAGSLIFGRSSTAIDFLRVVNPATAANSQLDLDLETDAKIRSILTCWDEENESTIAVVEGPIAGFPAGSRRRIVGVFRVADSGLTIVPSDVGFTSSEINFNALAAGGGAVLHLYGKDGVVLCRRSTDGGATWFSITPPALADSPQTGLAYVKDFLAAGPAFAFSEGVSGGVRVHYTRDEGASWSFLFAPFSGGSVFGDFLINGAAFVGRGFAIYDLLSGFETQIRTRADGSQGATIADGYRLFSSSTAAPDLYVSGWLVPPPAIDGSDQDF